MWGFEDRTDPATGTLDPLYARVLVLEAGGKRIAIVALDLGRTFGEPSLDHLKEVVSKSSAYLVPAGECFSYTWSSGNQRRVRRRSPEWEQKALGEIAAAIQYAAGHLQDARMGLEPGQFSSATTGCGRMTMGR